MYVLGIETSCDETAAAVVKDGREISSNVVSSSINFHKQYGGIVPEIAFRKQLETITEVVECALKRAKTPLKKIGLISVTSGPGLLGSLLVGVSFAKSLSLSSCVPFIGINHIYSHIYSSFLVSREIPEFPCVALVVSGGHTSLYYMRDFDKIKLIGSTLDDACGEAFDKVAKILGLGYPGGPLIEKAAQNGDPNSIRFSCSNTKNPFDFSFSGIKTAVLYYVRKNQACISGSKSPRSKIADICAGFQEAALNCLVEKSVSACMKKRTNTLLIGGGVTANNRLRDKFLNAAGKHGLKVRFPLKTFCTDNAAMVAGLGYRLFKKGYVSDLDLSANPNEGG
jgi:N6-L-threonylcarbamoyladenine synthase